MLTLASFPDPPPENSQTICERNSRLIQRSLDDEGPIENIPYPAFFGSTDKCKLIRHRDLKDPSPFIQTHEPFRVQLIRAWSKHGLMGVLIELATLNKQSSNRLGGSVSAWASKVLNFLRRLQSPYLAMSTEEMLRNFSLVQNWSSSHIRHMAWHPHEDKLAIALRDDEVLIKECHAPSDPRALRLASQKQIVMLAWRPYSASELAVACSSCIIIWHVQPSSLAATSRSASTTTNQILSKPGHCPISSIAWTPIGDLLVSCSPMDRGILIWNTGTEEHQAIRCTPFMPLITASFTPDSLRLLTTSSSNSFHVWECKDWSSAVWGDMAGPVAAHAWSPDGNILLFCPSRQSIVYALYFASTKTSSDWLAVTRSPSAVLSLGRFEGGEGLVGGVVHQMVWDPHGERLAISFKGESSPLIAIYQTRWKPVFKALPRGFVRGVFDERVSMMAFKPSFPAGSLLSVAWSSGRISHVPFYYTPGLVIGQPASRELDTSTNQRPTMDQLLSFDGNLSLNASPDSSCFLTHRSFEASSRHDQSTGIWF